MTKTPKASQKPNARPQRAWERAFSELPPKCRMAIILVRGGKSDEEAAQQLGISTETCTQLIHNAMVHLLEGKLA